MSLFKKKSRNLPLPPPPVPGESRLKGDIEPIRSRPVFPELPPVPEPPSEGFAPKPKVEEVVSELPPVPEVPKLPSFPREKEVPFLKPVREPVKRVAPDRTFVAVSEYRKIILSSGEIKSRLAEAEGHLARLGEIKAQEEALFEKWQSGLESVGKKLTYVDSVIAKAGGSQ